MRISRIGNIFSKKDNKVFVSPKTKEGVQKLLEEMRSQTQYKLNAKKTNWQSNILAGVSTGRAKFTDEKLFTDSNMRYDCSLSVGKKNILLIDSSTGEVVGHKTGYFTTLRGLIQKAEVYVSKLLENFNNHEAVEKHTFWVAGFTQKRI